MAKQQERRLPEGWRWVKLGDVCDTKLISFNPQAQPDKEFIYVDISSIDNICKTIVDPKTFLGKNAPSRARRIIKAGDVILSTTRPNLNAVAIVPEKLGGQVCSTGFCILRSTHVIDANFLFYFVRNSHFVANLSSLVQGALYPAVTDKQVYSQSIPLPPIAEQKRLVAILNDRFAAIETARKATEAQLEAAKALPAAYLREVFNSPEAEGWRSVKLGDICKDISDGSHFTPTYISEGIPFLSVKDIREHGIYFENCRFISQEEHQKLCQRCYPKKGDVLYTKVGTTGIAKAIDFDREFSVFVSVALLKLQPKILPGYIEMALNSPLGRSQAEQLTQGMANRNLVLRDIKTIEIPLPPIAKQKEIVTTLNDRFSTIETIRKAIEDQLEAINALPATLLRQAFNGEL